jgi:hypothetical protein
MAPENSAGMPPSKQPDCGSRPRTVRYSRSMTRKEAEEQCARLALEHPDRETHQWRPRQEANGEWSIMKIALPPLDLNRQAELRG